MSDKDILALTHNVIAGLPGAMTEGASTLSSFQKVIDTYSNIDETALRANLIHFIKAITPTAEAVDVSLAIHPDDPPFSLFGLPRVVSTVSDIRMILDAVDSIHNGLCFCTGSFGVRADNDLPAMIKEFGERIHFIHLRATRRDEYGNFHEANHLDGDIDMYAVMKELSMIQASCDISIPMRPDHGHKMLDDLSKKTSPGYSAIGRLRGLAELRGLELGVIRNSQL